MIRNLKGILAMDLCLLPPSSYWKNLASMDRLCCRSQSEHYLPQLNEAAGGSGLSGRTPAGLQEHDTPHTSWFKGTLLRMSPKTDIISPTKNTPFNVNLNIKAALMWAFTIYWHNGQFRFTFCVLWFLLMIQDMFKTMQGLEKCSRSNIFALANKQTNKPTNQ